MFQRSFGVSLCLLSFSLSGCALRRAVTNNFGALPPEPYIISPAVAGVSIPAEPAQPDSRSRQYFAITQCSRYGEKREVSEPNGSKKTERPCEVYSVPLANCGALAQLMGNEVADKSVRDALVSQWMYAIVLSHGSYLGKVSAHRASFDTFTDLATLGVTAASAVAPGAALGATATGIVGAKASVDKNFYSDLSRFAMLVAAQKSVDAAKQTLDEGLKQPPSGYSMGQACNDLASYYRSAEVVYAVSKFAEKPTGTTNKPGTSDGKPKQGTQPATPASKPGESDSAAPASSSTAKPATQS